MALCCIGGVCIPYTALLPLLVYAAKWLLEKVVAVGILPKTVQERLVKWVNGTKQQQQRRAKNAASDSSSPCCNDTTAAASSCTAESSKGIVSATKRPSPTITTVQSTEHWTRLTTTHHPPTIVVSKFTATWCAPCKKIQPVYEELHAEWSDRAKFCVTDVDDVDEVAAEHRVAMLPTFLVVHRGKEVARYTGSCPVALREWIGAAMQEAVAVQ